MNKWDPVDRTVPIVGLPADTTAIDGLHFHAVGDKYVRAVAEAADAAPVMIPSLGRLSRLPELLERLDGVVVTGATSNVRPDRYGAAVSEEAEPFDEHRDATTIDLIRLALSMSVPMLAICRGIQELNVALGGTLQSEIQNQPGKLDHRAPKSDDFDVRYGPVHGVTCAAGGILRRIMGTRELRVNSLHRQAIGRVAESLFVEATAPDGTIEAVSVKTAGAFALGVQWHPEYKAINNPDSVKLFQAFGDAARERARPRRIIA
jgi:putative glutamine amidotransferase